MIKWLNYILLSGCLQAKHIQDNSGTETEHYDSESSFTWVGLLMQKETPAEAVARSSTIIILIDSGVAVGLAEHIAGREPEESEVIFWQAAGGTLYCDVDKYKVHPEYYAGNVNSLALVFLIPPSVYIQWLPINWTRSDIARSPAIVVGIDHVIGSIRQSVKQVVKCDELGCDDSTKRINRLSVHNMPKDSCYRDRANVSFCENNAGMPLVYREGKDFQLFAIGAGGPACASCSRWIHFHPHHGWVRESKPHLRAARVDQGMYDYYEDLDQRLITKIYQSREIGWADNFEMIKGPCSINQTTVIYHEEAHFITNQQGSYASYSLSLYDQIYKDFACVTLCATTCSRSKVRWWVTSGFQQEDIDLYVKKVPYSYNRKIEPKIVFLMDKYRLYRNIKVTHVSFEFSFDLKADLNLLFIAKT